MRPTVPFLLFLLLAACGSAPDTAAHDNGGTVEGQGAPPDTPLRPASQPPQAATGEWRQGQAGLTFFEAQDDTPQLELQCLGGTLVVRLPGVRPVGSEERLTFGGGGEVETLVASPGNALGIEARGPVPPTGQLDALLKAGPGASYGATAIGPLAPVPDALREALVATCR